MHGVIQKKNKKFKNITTNIFFRNFVLKLKLFSYLFTAENNSPYILVSLNENSLYRKN